MCICAQWAWLSVIFFSHLVIILCSRVMTICWRCLDKILMTENLWQIKVLREKIHKEKIPWNSRCQRHFLQQHYCSSAVKGVFSTYSISYYFYSWQFELSWKIRGLGWELMATMLDSFTQFTHSNAFWKPQSPHLISPCWKTLVAISTAINMSFKINSIH